MITEEENDLLAQTGPATPCGELLRRYWQPAALSEELPPGGPPRAITLLGEDLVLFRGGEGPPGLLALHCSHRGADLSYGRQEDGGLRCIYHGWLYDVAGRCLDQPGEPRGGEHRNSIRHPAYPCREIGGIILAYLGPGKPPLVPNYEIFTAPESHRTVDKTFYDCNYLQGQEGNLDPVHLSFLHRRFGVEWGEKVQQVRSSTASSNALFAADTAPAIGLEMTDFGFRIASLRRTEAGKAYLRLSNYIYPNLAAVPAGGPGTAGEGYTINWQVPIDDLHSWNYIITFSRTRPLRREEQNRELDANYVPVRNRSNRYLQDREAMKSRSYSGIATFTAMDTCATEGAGPVQDRSREHLVSSDKAILTARKLMLKAMSDVQEGRDPPHVVRDPRRNRFPQLVVLSEVIPQTLDWKEHARRREAETSA
jgi:nitrite reductase/ring-hydroxylating ferredoxin subunit